MMIWLGEANVASMNLFVGKPRERRQIENCITSIETEHKALLSDRQSCL
jgi:hypothetical protein